MPPQGTGITQLQAMQTMLQTCMVRAGHGPDACEVTGWQLLEHAQRRRRQRCLRHATLLHRVQTCRCVGQSSDHMASQLASCFTP
jgi:hypothetical protein